MKQKRISNTAVHYHYATVRIRLQKAEIRFEQRIMMCNTDQEMDILTEEYRILVSAIKNNSFLA